MHKLKVTSMLRGENGENKNCCGPVFCHETAHKGSEEMRGQFQNQQSLINKPKTGWHKAGRDSRDRTLTLIPDTRLRETQGLNNPSKQDNKQTQLVTHLFNLMKWGEEQESNQILAYMREN